jgi:Spy/CpxP family protein refolding chaperone
MKLLIGFLLGVVSSLANAQHAQPYAGQEMRDIKALSDQEVSQYLSGAGMGYAKAAELNGFPGPMHVLEWASALDLSSDQQVAIRQLMERHKAQARQAGLKVVEAERGIEALFRSGHVEGDVLAARVAEAARAQGDYRLTHLETHRRALALLTPAQLAKYSELRGYQGSSEHHHGGG